MPFAMVPPWIVPSVGFFLENMRLVFLNFLTPHCKDTESKSLVLIPRHTGWTHPTGWIAPGRKLESWSLVVRPFLASSSSSSSSSAYDLFVAAATDLHLDLDQHVDPHCSSLSSSFHPISFLQNVSKPSSSSAPVLKMSVICFVITSNIIRVNKARKFCVGFW